MDAQRRAELTDLKKELRSIVVSSQFEIDVNGLKRDFRSINGITIPTSKFNYRDLNTFLREQCGDVFQFRGPWNNPVLIPIITDEIKHLNALICQQKSSKIKGRKRMSIHESSLSNKGKENRTNSSDNETCKVSNRINSSFKDAIVPLRKEPVINWPNIQEQSRTSIVNNNSNTNSFRQTNLNAAIPNKAMPVAYKTYPEDNRQAECKKIQCKPATPDDVNIQDPVITTYAKSSDDAFCPETQFANLRISDNTPDNKFNKDADSTQVRPFSASSESTFRSSLYSQNELNDFMQPGSSRSCSVQSSYESKDQKNSCPSFRRKKREKDLIGNFNKLAAKHPDGIWASEFNIKYKELFGCELNFNGMGFISITQMCRNFPSCWRILRPIRHGDALLLHPQFDPEKSTLFQENSMRSSPEPTPFEMLAPRKTDTKSPDALPGIDFSAYPPGSLTFHEHIEPLELPPAFTTPDAMIEIHVAEISDPTHFWYQLHGPRNSVAMNDIMDCMNVFYNSPEGNDYKFVYDAVQVGLFCAALYRKDWHRAVIVQDCGPDSVKVRHVDYGTVMKVEMSEIRFLKREFAALKAQALRGRLARIRPNSLGDHPTYWPLKTIQMFLKLVFEKNLVASVYFYNEEKQFLSMFLTDTSIINKDVHINDELVNKGVAVVCPESDDTSSNDHWACKIHTYEDIENGDALTFSDMIYINEYEIPIEEVLSTLNQNQCTETDTAEALLDKIRQSTLLSHLEDINSTENMNNLDVIENSSRSYNSISQQDDETLLGTAISNSHEDLSAELLNFENSSEGPIYTPLPETHNAHNVYPSTGNFVPDPAEYHSYINPAAISQFQPSQGFPNFYPAPISNPIPAYPPGFENYRPTPTNVQNFLPVQYHAYPFPDQHYYPSTQPIMTQRRPPVYPPRNFIFPTGPIRSQFPPQTQYFHPPQVMMQALPQKPLPGPPRQNHNLQYFSSQSSNAGLNRTSEAQRCWNTRMNSNEPRSTQFGPQKTEQKNTEGFWDVNIPPFVPQSSKETNGVPGPVDSGLLTSSAPTNLPSDQRLLPAPMRINSCGINLSLFKFRNEVWTSVYSALQNCWKDGTPNKPTSIRKFRLLSQTRFSPHTFDLYSVISDKQGRLSYVNGFLELTGEQLVNCSDVLISMDMLVPFIQINFENVVDSKLTILQMAITDIKNNKLIT